MFPLRIRVWHWINAGLFLTLALSGFALHLAGTGAAALSFRWAVRAHNTAGVLIVANYLFFLAGLARRGEWRQYAPQLRGLPRRILVQVRYYVDGIFHGAHHPFPATPEHRFNPIQQLVYLKFMLLLFPLLALTGVFMLFPATAPVRVAALGGVWPMALAHTLLAYTFLAFLVTHLYLALTASEPQSGLRAMIFGRSKE